jgi:membrane-anchored protein YejM (alkaline phosphatase superfamily)
VKVGFFEFLVFALYYVILKALIQLINLETRRNGLTVPAAVSGLFA